MHFRVFSLGLTDFITGVHYGCVVPASEVSTDFLQAVPRKSPGEVHTNLTGQGDALASFFALQVCQANVKVMSYDIDYVSDAYVPG